METLWDVKNLGRAFATLIVVVGLVGLIAMHAHGGQAPLPLNGSSLRLYVLDCGTLETTDPARYGLAANEVAEPRMSVACFLIVHPKGTLLWDVGAVRDSDWTPTGSPVSNRIELPSGQFRIVSLTKPLISQLAEIGFAPKDITYLALSHTHYDHTANANAFASATFIARKSEQDAMFGNTPGDLRVPAYYSALRSSKTLTPTADDFDVFGDGTVVIKFAPGHTPGHQTLYLKLPHTGDVLLAGDLYHYREERELSRLPVADFDISLTKSSRAKIEEFLKQKHVQLWIQHDFQSNAALKKSPAYYE